MRYFCRLLAVGLALALCFVLPVSVGIAATTDTAGPDATAESCALIATQDFADIPEAPTAIAGAEHVAGGGTDPSYCRITGVIAPQIQFELRLPDDWNGRYLQGGCSGFCGFIPIEACGEAQDQGFAVAASDLGHGGGPWAMPVWASDNQLRSDFAGRATHVLSLSAKAIIRAYYGSIPRFSYFQGCSTGGREGLYVAQHHPDDFDGIIAGAPAFAGRLGPIWNNWIAQSLLTADDRPVFSADDLTLLHSAVLRQCDGVDGFTDGIIADPRQCEFNPGDLQCASTQASDCLSVPQIAAARSMYSGPRNRQGVLLSPGGAAYGSELDWNGSLMAQIAQNFLRFLSFDGVRPAYDYRDFNWDDDIASVEAAAYEFDPVGPREAPELAAFQEGGGRLIVYQGQADSGVPPAGILDYYANVWMRSGGLEQTRNWFRLFLIPGMAHCGGGSAPNSFDMLSPLVRWVESGEQPDGIVATQFDDMGAAIRNRPIFAYPNIAQYAGQGDPNEASAWVLRVREEGPDRIDWIWAPSQ